MSANTRATPFRDALRRMSWRGASPANPSGVPVVPGLPLLGNLLDFRDDRAGFALRLAREFGDIARIRVGIFPAICLSSADLVHEVLVEKEVAFKKSPGLTIFARPLLGNGLLSSERDLHRRQRKMIAPMFINKRIAAYADVMASRAEKMAARWKDGAEINVADDMMELTLEIVGKTLFDAEVSSEAAEINDALTVAMEHIVGSLNSLVPFPPTWPTPRNRKFHQAIGRLDATIYRVIKARRQSEVDKGDLLSMLLLAQEEDESGAVQSGRGMSDQQVRDEAMTLFLAGHETMANAMAWAFYLLAQHPHAYHRLLREVDAVLAGRTPTLADLPKLPYALQVIKESMRLYPPAYTFGRWATEDVVIGGHPIKKNTAIMINTLGMHRRAKYFPDPERFDPERFTAANEKALPRYAYVPFGAGPRICIGNHFALMEGHILLATLAQRARFELLPGVHATMEPLMTLRPRGGVPARVRVRARAD